jgi:two-component system sensor histidine kinase RegB
MRSTHDINLSWLTRLRWGAVGGQLTTIAVVHSALEIRLPLVPLAVILGIEVVTNVTCVILLRSRAAREVHLAALLTLDIVTLTALLYFTGGPYNPFSFLYLVYIALAAVVLRPAWTWPLGLLSVAGFGMLFVGHVPIAEMGGHAHHLRTHVEGMGVAFAVAAAFTLYFTSRIKRALALREEELERARAATEKQSRLASLATLATGAAHELSTPLGTIAVAARELERRLERLGDPAAREDACLIRSEVARCRAILEQLAADAGHAADGVRAEITVRELATAIAGDRDVTIQVADDIGAHRVSVPVRPLVQALAGLVTNAVTAAGTAVELRCALEAGALRVEVRDHGPGMAPEVLARAGEPFFTTKEPGSGMGLGLFLARTVVERLGGTLQLESKPGAGTRAIATVQDT